MGNNVAFAALHGANRVVGWGVAASGGTVPDEIAALTDVVELSCATAHAFALRHGTPKTGVFVKTWGNASYGGTVNPIIAGFNDILTVVSTWQSFAALRGNGRINKVVAWEEMPTPVAWYRRRSATWMMWCSLQARRKPSPHCAALVR